MVAETVTQLVDYLKNKSDLNRIGLAQQEQLQDRSKKSLKQILDENSAGLEKLLRSAPQLQAVLADIRRGLRSRANSFTVREFDTNTIPVTGNGVEYQAARHNGGVPWDSFTLQQFGGVAAGNMRLSINGSDELVPVEGDFQDNLEIWTIRLRATTGAAGTGRVVLTSYIPGLAGLERV